MSALYEILQRISGPEQLLRDEPMSAHTTFRVGGPADLMFFPENAEQLCAAMDAARACGTDEVW